MKERKRGMRNEEIKSNEQISIPSFLPLPSLVLSLVDIQKYQTMLSLFFTSFSLCSQTSLSFFNIFQSPPQFRPHCPHCPVECPVGVLAICSPFGRGIRTSIRASR